MRRREEEDEEEWEKGRDEAILVGESNFYDGVPPSVQLVIFFLDILFLGDHGRFSFSVMPSPVSFFAVSHLSLILSFLSFFCHFVFSSFFSVILSSLVSFLWFIPTSITHILLIFQKGVQISIVELKIPNSDLFKRNFPRAWGVHHLLEVSCRKFGYFWKNCKKICKKIAIGDLRFQPNNSSIE